jgi:glyoxylate reductase
LLTKKGSKKLKILLTRTLQDFAVTELRKHYDVEIHHGPFPMPKITLMKKIKNKQGLICYPYDIIDKEIINTAKNLKVISAFSVGFDNIDIKYAKRRKIVIGYTPEVLTIATADLTMTLILDLLRRVSEGDRMIRENNWKEVFGADTYVGADLAGKTLGILGLGRIGCAVAQRAQAFGMNIIYHNRQKAKKSIEKRFHAKFVDFESLFKKADIISIHVPYTNETHELVNLKLIKQMKKTAFLINTARGKIVKEEDLIFALRKKLIAGAALDVFYKEPVNKKNPLTKIPNVVLSPHLGSSTKETRIKMAQLTVDNLKLGLSRKKPIYKV